MEYSTSFLLDLVTDSCTVSLISLTCFARNSIDPVNRGHDIDPVNRGRDFTSRSSHDSLDHYRCSVPRRRMTVGARLAAMGVHIRITYDDKEIDAIVNSSPLPNRPLRPTPTS